MNVKDILDFVLWADETHPAYMNNLIQAYKRYKIKKGE